MSELEKLANDLGSVGTKLLVMSLSGNDALYDLKSMAAHVFTACGVLKILDDDYNRYRLESLD